MINFYLPNPPEYYKEKLTDYLADKLNGDTRKVKVHLTFNFYKYLYIISKIYQTNIFFNRKADSYCALGVKHLEFVFKTKAGIAQTIINNGIDCGFWSRTEDYSYTQRIAKNFKVVDTEYQFKKYAFDIKDNRWLKALDTLQKQYNNNESRSHFYFSKFTTDTDLTKRTAKFLMNIDFSDVDVNSLNQDHKNQLEMYNDNKFQVFDNRTNRIYNSFTNLPTAIRDQVKYGGEKLGSVDLVNSQLIFFTEVIKEFIDINDYTLDDQSKFIFQKIKEGRFYETIFQVDSLTGKDRRKAKNKVFEFLYGKANYSDRCDVGMIFFNQYHQLWQWIIQINDNSNNKLALQLQAKESHIIQTAYKNLNIDAITLHDAIYCKESDLELVKQELFNTCKNMGVECRLLASDGEIMDTTTDIEFNPIKEVLNLNEINNEALQNEPQQTNQDYSPESTKIQPQEKILFKNKYGAVLDNFDWDATDVIVEENQPEEEVKVELPIEYPTSIKEEKPEDYDEDDLGFFDLDVLNESVRARLSE